MDAGDFSPTNGFPVVFIFVNSGKSPAKNVTFSNMFLNIDHRVSGPNENQIKQLIQTPVNDIAPQGKLRENIGRIFPGGDVTAARLQGQKYLVGQYQQISDGTEFLYYYGRVEYDDIFHTRHHTDYCMIIVDAKTKATGFCDKFNDIN